MSEDPKESTLLDRDISVLRFLDKLIPSALYSNISELFKARTLALMVCILVALSCISMLMVILVDQNLNERRLITIMLISLMPFSLVLLWWKKATRQASWYLIATLILTILYIDHNNASFKGAFSIIWILPPAIAVMLLGGRASLQVMTVSILGMFTNFTLLKLDKLPIPITPPENWLNAQLIISVAVIMIVTFSVYALSKLAKQKESELSEEIESRKQIAVELEEAKNTAEQAAANKSMFLATMSHELRTPLNAILGNAELLSRETLEARTGSRVKDIHSAGQLLISIINDILDLSKFDSYGIELSNEIYDISDQLHRIQRMMLSKLKPGVEFVMQGTDKALFIKADQNRLSQVILNLVSNAVKFTEQGRIILSLSSHAYGIEIQVKDTGVGISEEDAKNLFQEFVQVRKHANRQVEGTGLGLAIIRRIVDRMSGSIELESAEGKGSTFIIKLPVEIIDHIQNEDISNLDTQSAKTDLPEDFSSLKVLIVDDVPMNCVILSALLEELGVSDIDEEHDGEDALARIQKGEMFDLILMDVRMPKMDGIEATQQIRALGYTHPIIAVTANAFEEDKQGCLSAGMSDFLSKPIELDKLIQVLNASMKS